MRKRGEGVGRNDAPVRSTRCFWSQFLSPFPSHTLPVQKPNAIGASHSAYPRPRPTLPEGRGGDCWGI